MTAVAERPARDHDPAAEYHVYEPHRVGIPPLGPYFRELWRRRHFMWGLARADLRDQHFNTAFGQLWLLINPLLLTLVYFLLVTIVRGGSRGSEFFAHLMLCLFTFRFVSRSIREGGTAVVGGGQLILNTAFPRMLLPLSSVITGVLRFLPTLLLYAVAHVVLGLPIGLELLWAIPIFAMLAVFATGATMFVATAQVYFRDLKHFLRYFLRIWLYTSPVIYYADDVPERFRPILNANPLYPLLGSLSDAVNQGQMPNPALLAYGFAWTVSILVIGVLFFISREREFAVRL
jgi:ABC-type polysaccharide/polyol phosphate export permease